jgi:hypothetical protein
METSFVMGGSFFPMLNREDAQNYLTCRKEDATTNVTHEIPCKVPNAGLKVPTDAGKPEVQPIPNENGTTPYINEFNQVGQMFCRRQQEKTFSNDAKILHTDGITVPVHVEILNNPGKYTGVFEKSKNGFVKGMLRLSAGNKPIKKNESNLNSLTNRLLQEHKKRSFEYNDHFFSPSFALRIFRSNAPSCDIPAMYSFTGQPFGYNILEHELSHNIAKIEQQRQPGQNDASGQI